MSDLFKLNIRDVVHGLVMAVFSGIALPVVAIIQTPGFNIFDTNWHQIIVLAINGAIIGFVTYITKKFFSDSNGAVFGRIGRSKN